MCYLPDKERNVLLFHMCMTHLPLHLNCFEVEPLPVITLVVELVQNSLSHIYKNWVISGALCGSYMLKVIDY